MCYYKTQKLSGFESLRLKDLEKALTHFDLLGRDLITGFDYGPSLVLKARAGVADFDIVPMEWGFIPPYIRSRRELQNMRQGYQDATGRFRPPLVMLNAVSEELLLPGKLFREAALQRRCLVLSTGFFEWRHVFPLGKKGQPLKTPVKYPYFIRVKDRPYFYMAGIWQPWTDRETGEYVESFAIVTTAANSLMEQIHNSKKRMPCILPDDLAWEWMFGTPDEAHITSLARYQLPAEQMQACTIARDFREAAEPTTLVTYDGIELFNWP